MAKLVLDTKYLNYIKSKIRLRERLLYANEAPIRALENVFEIADERQRPFGFRQAQSHPATRVTRVQTDPVA